MRIIYIHDGTPETRVWVIRRATAIHEIDCKPGEPERSTLTISAFSHDMLEVPAQSVADGVIPSVPS
jgi:hypothetical protein